MPVNMSRNLASSDERRDRDGRRRQPRQADRRHRGDELGLAHRAGGRQAGHCPARPLAGVAPGPPRPGERDAARQHRRRERPGRPEPLLGPPAFQLWTCEAKGAVDCSQDSQFTRIFTSPADAFPSGVPRPRAPELIMRSFDVPQTKATHVRIRVAHEPVHGRTGVPGRPGRRPGQLDRLRRDDAPRLRRERRARPRRGAAGLLELGLLGGGPCAGAPLPLSVCDDGAVGSVGARAR